MEDSKLEIVFKNHKDNVLSYKLEYESQASSASNIYSYLLHL